MTHKKFMDIQRIKEGIVDNFQVGDWIYITEKIDGANAAIRYDSETNTVIAQSRKNILNISNNLRGFYEFTQTLNVDKVKAVLGDNLVLFGEWLVKHSVPYPDEKYNTFYAFDVYDTDKEKYLPQIEAIRISNELGLTFVPVFYMGEFQSWEHCLNFVGKTALGGEYGEGCFNSRTKILMADDTEKYITEIKVGDLVKSYNINTNQIENKKVTNVFNNGKKELNQWYNIAVFSRGTSSKNNISGKFCATKNHNFYCGEGKYAPIEKCNSIYHYGKIFDKFREQAFLGLMLSDMHYSKGIFTISQANKRSDDFYSLFKDFLTKKSNLMSGKGSLIDTLHFRKQETIKFEENYIIDNQINYIKAFDNLDLIGWSFFFMGDGYGGEHGNVELCLASYTLDECNYILNCFNKYFNTNAKLSFDNRVTNGCGGRIRTSNSEGRRIMVMMSKYIMPKYRYKISAINNAESFVGIPPIEFGLTKRKLYSKKELSELKTWKGHNTITAYDIEVEDNHNYFANGCLVHNCVVKNQSRLNDPNNRQPFYLKIVGEQFKEVHERKDKTPNAEQLKSLEENYKLCKTIVTEARVNKILNKFVDEGILPENWGATEMPIVAKNLTKAVYEDCLKEEPDIVKQISDFGKTANRICMEVARRKI